jgi:alpha-galactosidase
MAELVHLRGAAVSVVVDVGGPATVVHWGAPLLDDDLAALAAALDRPVPHGALDVEAPVAIVPEHGSGFTGRPGLVGRRLDRTAWSPRVTPVRHTADERSLTAIAVDPVAGIEVQCEMQLDASDILAVRASVTNLADSPYSLDQLSVTLPVPPRAVELLTFTGRWCREFHPRRVDWLAGAFTAENRRGRTSHDHVPVLFAGTPGFGEWHGEVWGAHLAWSGNNVVLAEVLSDGRRFVQLGELLHPGEVELAPGAVYRTPWVYAAYARDGLNGTSSSFHRFFRSRPGHPGPDRPRPVLVNTWEAVYFDHRHEVLTALADRAAAIGVERFVLDDGWFHARRHDRAGLGDWWVDPEVYPEGLGPLIRHVQGLGMEFGLWVEPEMVNPDSDLYRAHPDWALVDHRYDPPLFRNQLVLDLTNSEAFDHVLGQLDRLLTENDIAYLKWDMNRDHTQATHALRAGTSNQTLALYDLLDELRSLHPDVEIESCSSGGARADAEILRRTIRIWTSDCNDPVERQLIQRGFSYLFPPELMGAHIGGPWAHTTGRSTGLGFRAVTAFFGHLGLEWNLLTCSDDELDRLGDVIALHRRLRPLLHGGDVVRFDGADPSALAHGVYAADRSEAVVAHVQLTSPVGAIPGTLCLPGLDPDRRYRVSVVGPRDVTLHLARHQPAWVEHGIELSGRQLAAHGLQLPVLGPQSALLVHLVGT